MINDSDHQRLKVLLRKAYEGPERWESLEAACRIVGVTLDKGFVNAEAMKAGRKPVRLSDDELAAALEHCPGALRANQPKW